MSHIFVTGRGMVCSLGIGVETIMNAIFAGQCGFRHIQRFETEGGQSLAGVLSEEDEIFLREHYDETDLLYAMLKKAGEEALAMTKLPQQTGLIVATNFGIMEAREWAWRERIEHGELNPDSFDLVTNAIEHLRQLWGLEGPAVQLSLSCASGAAAIAVANLWLRTQRCDAVLVLAGDLMSEFAWAGLNNLRTITPDMIRPFNRERQGTIFGEGAIALVLKREEALLADDPRLACILGAATNNNAWHMTAPVREGEGSARVMTAALRDAGCKPDQIDMISAHATGTQANDITESQAIRNVFGSHRVPVAAFKSQIGHLMGGAGLAEIAITIECLQRGEIPPVRNTRELDPECDVDVVWPEACQGKFNVALTNSAGLGGNNAAVVLSRPDWSSDPRPLAEKSVKIHRCSWILPEGSGCGGSWKDLGDARENLLNRSQLSSFSAKEYVQTVKGYLDPGSAFVLGALALIRQHVELPEDLNRVGIVCGTMYGALDSAFRYFEALVKKGNRFASPLIFPHSYPNTAANLGAIEFSFGGPHIVCDSLKNPGELFSLGEALLRNGEADLVFVVMYEGALKCAEQALPDGVEVLPGALVACLAPTEEGETMPTAIAAMGETSQNGIVFNALRLLNSD
ncbi:MAG: hypothetical protein D6820_17825 [Lentisphaerae bacterium]|nr:MAG: hypothetical protein D6820_17825 [Lentisphaerota bacterium]